MLVLAKPVGEQPLVRLLAFQYSAGEEGCFLERRFVVEFRREIVGTEDGVDLYTSSSVYLSGAREVRTKDWVDPCALVRLDLSGACKDVRDASRWYPLWTSSPFFFSFSFSIARVVTGMLVEFDLISV